VAAFFSSFILTTAHPHSYGYTEINNNWTLDSDFTGGLRITGNPPTFPFFPLVNLNGHTVTVDQEGIEVNAGTNTYLSGGTLTSSESFLDLRLLSQSGNNGYSYISTSVVISDSDHQVGLRIAGNDPGEGGITLAGDQSNTFTGNIEVSGRRNHLVLHKENGAIAIRGNFLIKDRALVRFSRNNQTLGTSNVTLKNYGVLQELFDSDITNTLKNLIIEDNGIVHFNHEEGNSANAKYYIYFDDLIIRLNR